MHLKNIRIKIHEKWNKNTNTLLTAFILTSSDIITNTPVCDHHHHHQHHVYISETPEVRNETFYFCIFIFQRQSVRNDIKITNTLLKINTYDCQASRIRNRCTHVHTEKKINNHLFHLTYISHHRNKKYTITSISTTFTTPNRNEKQQQTHLSICDDVLWIIIPGILINCHVHKHNYNYIIIDFSLYYRWMYVCRCAQQINWLT